MRDGVELSSDIYRPRAPGPFPTVLFRTPYSNNSDVMISRARSLANAGYVCVVQDIRGRWDSDGDYYPFVNDGPDGFDTQEWIGDQEWSNGRIGMAGGSYVALVQWQSAVHRSRYLTCMAPRVIATDFFGGLVFPGGAFQLNVLATWGMRTNGRTGQSIEYHDWTEAFRHLPMIQMDRLAGRDLDFWKDWIEHPTYDDYWKAIDVEGRWDEIAAPAFNMGGWYDLYAPDSFKNFNGLRLHGGTPEARQSKLIVGPWPHGLSESSKTGDVDFGAGSLADLDGMETRWFDYWLKGIENGVVDEPPLRLFIMGVNEWRDEHEWPLARTRLAEVVPPLGRRRQRRPRRRRAVYGRARRRAARPLRLRSALPGADDGRRELLLEPHRAVGPVRPAQRRDADRRALLHVGAPGAGHGGNRADHRGPVRRHGRAGHRLDRQAGRRVAQRLRHEPVRRHPARPLPRKPHRSDPADRGTGLPVRDRGLA